MGIDTCTLLLLTVGTFVAVGSRIKVTYLGSLCELEVVELVIENGETVGTDHSTDEAHINDRLSSIHLSSESRVHEHNPPRHFFRCVNGTSVTLHKPSSAESKSNRAAVTLDDVGGVDSQKDFLTRLVSSMLDVQRASAIKQSGNLQYSDDSFICLCTCTWFEFADSSLILTLRNDSGQVVHTQGFGVGVV